MGGGDLLALLELYLGSPFKVFESRNPIQKGGLKALRTGRNETHAELRSGGGRP